MPKGAFETTDAIYYHAFNLLPQIGPRRLGKIVRHFENPRLAWESHADEWKNIDLEAAVVESVLWLRASVDIEDAIRALKKLQINLLTWSDDGYPALLKEIVDPPPVLYYRGTLPSADALMVAVVGTRKITGYGKIATQIIGKSLASAGVVIVSGMAYGVDAAAHSAALDAGMATVAVLGGGIDDKAIYPQDHVLLAQRIIDGGGCIMGENPPGSPGLKGNFIARNRIISGLCAATVVVECDIKSGALVTAKFALEQNRLVFAVPGPITSRTSDGPNRLIQQGARPLLAAGEILNELNIATGSEVLGVQAKTLPPLSTGENILLQLLSQEPKLPDQLIEESELSAGQVSTALGMLELKGLVRNLGANQYVRNT